LIARLHKDCRGDVLQQDGFCRARVARSHDNLVAALRDQGIAIGHLPRIGIVHPQPVAFCDGLQTGQTRSQRVRPWRNGQGRLADGFAGVHPRTIRAAEA